MMKMSDSMMKVSKHEKKSAYEKSAKIQKKKCYSSKIPKLFFNNRGIIEIFLKNALKNPKYSSCR